MSYYYFAGCAHQLAECTVVGVQSGVIFYQALTDAICLFVQSSYMTLSFFNS